MTTEHIKRESAAQIIRERFHLGDDERLEPLVSVDDHIDHIRQLHVTVPIADENVTDVMFVQSAQYVDKARKHSLVFPPLGARADVSSISVKLHAHPSSLGQTALTVVEDEAKTFSAAYSRLGCIARRINNGAIVAQGFVAERTAKTITLATLDGSRVSVPWPSEHIILEYEKPPIQYGIAGMSYVVISTEKSADADADVHLDYSLSHALSARIQYDIVVPATTGVCSFGTTYIVENQSHTVDFDRITTLRIVDSTRPSTQRLDRARVLPMLVLPETTASSPTSSSSSYASQSDYPVQEADSLVKPVAFTYTQGLSVAPRQSVSLIGSDASNVHCSVVYQLAELQPYKAYVPQVSSIVWFLNEDLAALSLQNAQTRVTVNHSNGEQTTSAFYWDREDDVRSVLAGDAWISKRLTSTDASKVRVEIDSVTEGAKGIAMNFHVNNYLTENIVITVPVYPNQVDGRCLSVDGVDAHQTTHNDAWRQSALPQVYAVFEVVEGKRLNLRASFSRRS